MSTDSQVGRSLGLLGATGVGVGAIVGGGILALAGVAYATTGPGAVVAFALNGLIALLTVFSFAEVSTAFPESGGSYVFARRVLTIQAAFAVGWVVWFASIVAAVLYALGFAAYGVVVVEELWRVVLGESPPWLTSRPTVILLALGATAFYTFSLFRKSTGGGQWATAGKVIVFVVLICGGVWALSTRSLTTVSTNLSPFFPGGAVGVIQAMGFTFIALQGYDLIAAVAGEVRDPGRVLPRAMFGSLGIALAIYLPLLFFIPAVGVQPGQSIVEMSAEHPETLIAVAAENFLGPLGFWLVMVAAVLSMLSALYANLLAALRVALAMARDRTLPPFFGQIGQHRGTPTAAISISAGFVAIILIVIPDIAAAGAAASLIFLISFALAHWTCILTRLRQRGSSQQTAFRGPWFPLLPVTGVVSCTSLAIFQGSQYLSQG